MELLVIFVGVFSGFILFLSFLFFLEIIFSIFAYLKPSQPRALNPKFTSSSAAILIPAHNEEDVLAATLESIFPQLRSGDEIIVVADNCSDSTVNIASQYDVTILIRNDSTLKGKGYALDFGLEYIREKIFDVVIVIDADCILSSFSRDILVNATMTEQKPMQALYLMKNNTQNPTVSQKIAEFSWLVKNKIRPLGLSVLGGPCQLMGTGMAFPLTTLCAAKLASGCVVEDMKLGLDLSVVSQAPMFLPAALVYSYFPSEQSVGEGQRSRWIHGHMEMILHYIPVLLLATVKKRDLAIFLIALDLMIFPLIMLLICNLLAVFISIVVSIVAHSAVWLLACAGLLLFGLSLAVSWLLEGKNILSLKEFFLGGFSLLKKFTVYTKFITDRRKEWNKTSRK